MTCIDQSDSYRRNSAVLKNVVLYSPDPPSVRIEGLGTRLLIKLSMMKSYVMVYPSELTKRTCSRNLNETQVT